STSLAGVGETLDVVLVFSFRDDLDVEEHQRVVLATELRALTRVSTLLLWREVHVVALAGDVVLLVQEVSNPERVHDVAALQGDLDRLSDGQDQHGKLVE